MKPAIRKRLAITLLAATSLTTATGCTPWELYSHGISFSLGWFFRDLTITTTTQTQCYLNGSPIDCPDLPS